jgi:hypothetical protein
MPNANLGVRRRAATARDAHGAPLPGVWGAVVGLLAGRVNERADGSWALGLDPSLWPVRVDDLVISDAGASWLVQTADLIRNNLDPSVDWVRVSAQTRTAGGTVPGGAWFVARYVDYAEPAPPEGGEPRLLEAGLWTGYGPPPTYDFGAQPGDEYIDLSTGVVYRLDAG